MARFRKKPVEVEAIKWTGENLEEIREFAGKALRGYYLPYNRLSFETLEGRLEASVGDWIIEGVKGEFYPCKPDIFDASYEEVT